MKDLPSLLSVSENSVSEDSDSLLSNSEPSKDESSDFSVPPPKSQKHISISGVSSPTPPEAPPKP